MTNRGPSWPPAHTPCSPAPAHRASAQRHHRVGRRPASRLRSTPQLHALAGAESPSLPASLPACLRPAAPRCSYLLTNADHKHAMICLERLGLLQCFEGIYDYESVQVTITAPQLRLR